MSSNHPPSRHCAALYLLRQRLLIERENSGPVNWTFNRRKVKYFSSLTLFELLYVFLYFMPEHDVQIFRQ